MIIETFKNGDTAAISDRFVRCGRMLPDGVIYHQSWIDAEHGKCYQMMEAPARESINIWTSKWDDLVDFEVVSVVASSEYWSSRSKD